MTQMTRIFAEEGMNWEEKDGAPMTPRNRNNVYLHWVLAFAD